MYYCHAPNPAQWISHDRCNWKVSNYLFGLQVRMIAKRTNERGELEISSNESLGAPRIRQTPAII
jgi:hypothetical protein